MSEQELKLIRRKAGELYALMTRLPELKSKQFLQDLGSEKAAQWRFLIKALAEWIDADD